MYLITDAPPDLEKLRGRLAGDVTVRADERWDQARAAWNLAVDQQPLAVAEPETGADVVAVVDYARRRGLRVAAQGTGHNAAPLGALDETILVRTHRMRGVRIDAGARRAVVQAGAVWQDVAAPASEHGLAALAGSAPGVGVVGYTLGGGLSWLGRKHGLACNGVVAIQVVTADGHRRVVGPASDPDVFWALRGGGGLGIVTAIEIELHEAGALYAGMLAWPWERASEVLGAWREWCATAPDEITTAARIVRVPSLPTTPEAVRGRSLVVVDGAHAGGRGDGARDLGALRALAPEIDTFTTVAPGELLEIHMDPRGPVAAAGDGALLEGVPAEAIDALVRVAGPESGSPLGSVELRQLGGALAREPRGAGALASLPGDFALFAGGMAIDDEMAAAVRARVDAVKAALAPWDDGRRYLGMTASRVHARVAYAPPAYRRLRAIKTLVDPDDLFQANHPIPAIA